MPVLSQETRNGAKVSERPRGQGDDLIMHWTEEIAAIRTQGDHNTTNVQVWDQKNNKKLRSVDVPEAVVFWRWIDLNKLGLVCKNGVYHYDYTEADGVPQKIFTRAP